MRREDRLRGLEVGVAGHQEVKVGGGLVDEGALEVAECSPHPPLTPLSQINGRGGEQSRTDLVKEVEAHVGGDLVVAAAARVEFAGGGANQLLEAALTHRSVSGLNNERLEFLGDGLLNFVIAAELYRRRPQCDEGDLSRLRANLVNRASLAQIARDLELGRYLRLGSGEMKSGGQRRDSILADAVEAIVGAIYLDGGFDDSRDCLHHLYRQRLDNLPRVDELKDPKTRLQEYLQGVPLPLPEYELLQVTGKAHAQTFRVACRVAGLELSSQGSAGSRRKAEQVAAQNLFDQLKGQS